MTTVRQILSLALKDASVIGEGETASAEATQDALSTLNQMLGMWQLSGLHVYAQQETSFVPTGAETYTIGAGATVNVTRPISIQSAFWRSNGIDYPIQILNSLEDYGQISMKTEAGEPVALFYRPSNPLGTIYLCPQPSTGTVHLVTLVDLPEYASQTADLSLPRSYEMPVRSNLAVLLCAVFGVPLRPDIASLARTSMNLLKRANVRIPQLQMPERLAGASSNVERGY